MPKVSSSDLLNIVQDKLNAISRRLYDLQVNSVSSDCSFMARSLREEFNLISFDNPSEVVKDFARLERLSKDVLSLVNLLHFVTDSERGDVLERLHDKASDLEIQLCIYGAFV